MNTNMQTLYPCNDFGMMKNLSFGYDMSQQVMTAYLPTYASVYPNYCENEYYRAYSDSTSQGSYSNPR